MSTEMLAGLIGFVVFFALWVVVPTLVHKKHKPEMEEE